MKRGVSQIDWIISLALFLLYVGWFFAFVAPQIDSASNRDSMMFLLKSKFENEFMWELQKFPIFIETQDLSLRKPLLVNFTLNTSDVAFADGKAFILWNEKIIFLGNITSNIETFWLLLGGENTQTYQFLGLNLEEDWASTEDMSIEFTESLPKELVYLENQRIFDIDYTLNDGSFNPAANGYNDSGFVGIYWAGTSNLNHTAMVFLDNSAVYNFLTFDNLDVNFTYLLEFELDKYEDYFTDNNHYGSLDFEEEIDSVSYEADYITFYDEDSLSMYFSEPVEINITNFNDTLRLQVEALLTGDFDYQYFFHHGNYTNATRSDYEVRYGVVQTIEGLTFANLTNNYTYYRERWGFPKQFNLRIFRNTTAYAHLNQEPIEELGIFDSSTRNVYALSHDSMLLDQTGQQTPVNINYRIW